MKLGVYVDYVYTWKLCTNIVFKSEIAKYFDGVKIWGYALPWNLIQTKNQRRHINKQLSTEI
jgi:hypothetical protein